MKATRRLLFAALTGAAVASSPTACDSAAPSSEQRVASPAAPSASPVSEVTATPAPASPSERALTTTFHVEELTCEGCAWQIRETLKKLDGVEDAKTEVAERRVAVKHEPARANVAAIVEALSGAGYSARELR